MLRTESSLARIRRRKGLTLRDLEVASGVSHGTICRLENGHRFPYPATARKLAAALGLATEELWDALEEG